MRGRKKRETAMEGKRRVRLGRDEKEQRDTGGGRRERDARRAWRLDRDAQRYNLYLCSKIVSLYIAYLRGRLLAPLKICVYLLRRVTDAFVPTDAKRFNGSDQEKEVALG